MKKTKKRKRSITAWVIVFTCGGIVDTEAIGRNKSVAWSRAKRIFPDATGDYWEGCKARRVTLTWEE